MKNDSNKLEEDPTTTYGFKMTKVEEQIMKNLKHPYVEEFKKLPTYLKECNPFLKKTLLICVEAIKFFDHKMITPDIINYALCLDPFIIRYVPEHLLTDKQIKNSLIGSKGKSYVYVPTSHRTPEMSLFAISLFPSDLEDLHDLHLIHRISTIYPLFDNSRIPLEPDSFYLDKNFRANAVQLVTSMCLKYALDDTDSVNSNQVKVITLFFQLIYPCINTTEFYTSNFKPYYIL